MIILLLSSSLLLPFKSQNAVALNFRLSWLLVTGQDTCSYLITLALFLFLNRGPGEKGRAWAGCSGSAVWPQSHESSRLSADRLRVWSQWAWAVGAANANVWLQHDRPQPWAGTLQLLYLHNGAAENKWVPVSFVFSNLVFIVSGLFEIVSTWLTVGSLLYQVEILILQHIFSCKYLNNTLLRVFIAILG